MPDDGHYPEDEPIPDSFESPNDEAAFFRERMQTLADALTDTRLAFDEFQSESKELEAELERELASLERQVEQGARREADLKESALEYKEKFQAQLLSHNKTQEQMQKELELHRKLASEHRDKLRDVEMENDDLEREGRMVTSSLADVQAQYNKSLERMALLEEEILTKSRLEEDMQRLKDELRDMTDELAAYKESRERLEESEEENARLRENMRDLHLELEQLREKLASATSAPSSPAPRSSSESTSALPRNLSTIRDESVPSLVPSPARKSGLPRSTTSPALSPSRLPQRAQSPPLSPSPLSYSSFSAAQSQGIPRAFPASRTLARQSESSPAPVRHPTAPASADDALHLSTATTMRSSTGNRSMLATPGGNRFVPGKTTRNANNILRDIRSRAADLEKRVRGAGRRPGASAPGTLGPGQRTAIPQSAATKRVAALRDIGNGPAEGPSPASSNGGWVIVDGELQESPGRTSPTVNMRNSRAATVSGAFPRHRKSGSFDAAAAASSDAGPAAPSSSSTSCSTTTARRPPSRLSALSASTTATQTSTSTLPTTSSRPTTPSFLPTSSTSASRIPSPVPFPRPAPTPDDARAKRAAMQRRASVGAATHRSRATAGPAPPLPTGAAGAAGGQQRKSLDGKGVLLSAELAGSRIGRPRKISGSRGGG